MLALGVVAALVSLLGRLTGSGAAGNAVKLAGAGGSEAWPSFSPDGKRWAYGGRRGKEENFHLYTDLARRPAPQATAEAGNDVGPGWSPGSLRCRGPPPSMENARNA